MITSHASGLRYPAMSLISVDFPPHDGQTNAVFFLACREREKLEKIRLFGL